MGDTDENRSARRRIVRVVRHSAVRVRNSRAWPVVRPAYRAARRVVNVDRLLGKPSSQLKQYQRTVDVMRRRLFNLGFVDRGLRELEEAATAEDTPAYLRRMAATEIALWHADQYQPENAQRALRFLDIAADGETDRRALRRLAVLRAECLQGIGDVTTARQVLKEALARGAEANLLLAAANLESDPEARVRLFNEALTLEGLSPVIRDPSAGATLLDQLRAATQVGAVDNQAGPLVSVIIPAYNCAGTIATALDSLLVQTWQNLEVLVVDDASSDGTAEVVSDYTGRDPRVRLIRATENSGTYVSRNLALQEATGEFVTCHDTDDWSHPEKIEAQVQSLLEHPDMVANTSQQARVAPDLVFHRRGKPGFFVFPNLSSLMFRRAPVMEALGYWDSVRFGADAELQRRIRRVFGASAMVDLLTGPMSLQRQSSGSLTANNAFGYPGYFMGARRDYFESYMYFHRTNPDALRYEFPVTRRPFAVPEPMLPNRSSRSGSRRHFDVIIASDLRLVGGSTLSSVEEVKAHKQFGLRTGLLQMPYYDADSRRVVTPRVRDIVDGDQVQMVVYGERVSCDLLIIRYPPVLREWQRFVPDVEAGHISVIVNQPPMSDYGPEGVLRYRIPQAQENLERYFGKSATWYPIGPLVRQALWEHHRDELPAIELSDEDWVNIIDSDSWRRSARPPQQATVRIGRHSRDNVVKWPATGEELLEIYPDDPRYEIHVLGGAEAPRSILGGTLPDNWHVHGFGELHPSEFLAALDVFVYYPNPDWVESFGRVILEAMAVGVPVVLPPAFKPLFGDAANYAEPAAALAMVDRLMADETFYAERAETARNFVEKAFGYPKHAERVGRFLGRTLA